MARPDLIPPRVEALGDIQALLKAGFGTLPEGCYLLARVHDAAAAKAWLATAKVTTAADLGAPQTHVLQLAFTASGLAALGLAPATLAQFSAEFLGGMAEPSRAGRLGDVGPSAPNLWDWGWQEREPHLLVILIAAAGALAPWRTAIVDERFTAGFTLLRTLETSDMGGREPFGFRDGVSQPAIDFAGGRTPGGTDDLDYGNLIAPGEFVLGYRNEYGLLTPRPLVAANDILPAAADAPGFGDLGCNGSYLVLRQLEQDVAGFWAFASAAHPADPAAIAEAMVGRGLAGAPRAGSSAGTIRGVEAGDDAALNGFTYHGDPIGRVCPIGAHVRRANPRTGDLPSGRVGPIAQLLALLGFVGDGDDDRIASSRFHRLLRRGREYGRPAPAESTAGAETTEPAGLHFVCLMANISRQFEFIQNAWFQSSTFAGLSGESDPLIGNRAPLATGSATDGFNQPNAAGAADRIDGLPPFVTVKGGAYFFLPGLRALRYIAG